MRRSTARVLRGEVRQDPAGGEGMAGAGMAGEVEERGQIGQGKACVGADGGVL